MLAEVKVRLLEEAMTKVVQVQDASLKDLLAQLKDGVDIVLQEGDKPVARLVPAQSRIPGLHRGAMAVSEDFDQPLPGDYLGGEA